MKNNYPVLYMVVPCYNEQEVLPITCKLFEDKIKELIKAKKISSASRVLFVNDGSKDKTWQIIKELSTNKYFEGISLSRNRGHQNALLAGLMEAKNLCDITISIDCDGQDDINAMNEMIDKYLQGNEIVYGVRSKRDTDTFFKRFTAESFYRILSIMGVESVFNHADYRLISSKVLNEFADYREVNLFLRGMVPLLGFKSDIVYYERHERIAGESHYPLSKMISLAIDGITSLSTKPLSIIFILGILTMIISFVAFVVGMIKLTGIIISTSIICFLLGGILLALGIIGEYIGKIYMEVKQRPRYIISERTYD